MLPVYDASVVAADCISLAKSCKERGGNHLGKKFSFCPKALTALLLHTTKKPTAEMWV